jgi:hypothetical protein
MLRIRREDLPFVGSGSHQFVGAHNACVGVSVFLFNGKPGAGPGPHRPLVQLDVHLSPEFIQENLPG